MSLTHAETQLGVAERSAQGWSGRLTPADLACLVIPGAIAFEIQSTGRLFVSEILLLVLLPFLLYNPARRSFTRQERVVLALGVAWLWAQVVTDLIRLTQFDDYSRGWLKIAFLLTNFAAIVLLISNQRRRIVLFAWGLVFGILIDYAVSPSAQAARGYWKFGIGAAVTYGVVLIGCHPRLYRIPFLTSGLLGVMGVVALSQDARSLGGECLLAAAYVAGQQILGKGGTFQRIGLGRMVAIGAAAALVAFGVLALYGYGASRGLFGAESAYKYTHQTTGKFGLLIGGRPQVYAEAQAMTDSPLIGHGSWARNSEYNLNLLRALYRAGYTIDQATISGLTHDDYVPVHSYILGAWVEAGILGGLFWIFVLFVAVSVVLHAYRWDDPLSPFVVLIAISLLWDLFFSPFGAGSRLSVAFFIALLLWARSQLQPQGDDAPWRVPASGR